MKTDGAFKAAERGIERQLLMKRTLVARITMIVAVVCATVAIADPINPRPAAISPLNNAVIYFNIPHLPINEAMSHFASQTGMSVMSERSFAGTMVGPLQGEYTIDAALLRLLANSGIKYYRYDSVTIRLWADRNDHIGHSPRRR